MWPTGQFEFETPALIKTSLGQLSLVMYIDPKLWSEIPENLVSFTFLNWKTKLSYYLANMPF